MTRAACKLGTQEVEGFGVILEALDITRVGENGNALYRSGKAFVVGMLDDRLIESWVQSTKIQSLSTNGKR